MRGRVLVGAGAMLVASCALLVDLGDLGTTLDASVNTAVCDGAPPRVTDDQAVWVSGRSGVDGPTCGPRAAPCKTLNAALARATAASLHAIYADDSTFVETLTLGSTSASLTIQGGFKIDGTDWTLACNDATTVIEGPADAGSATVDLNGSSAVTFRLLTVRSKANGANGSGESVYAVRIVDTPGVVLDNVVLISQNAGSGAAGLTPPTATGCTTTASGSQAQGASGQPGVGSFNASGFVPASGASGGDGGLGLVLAQPQAGACMTSCTIQCNPGATCGDKMGMACGDVGAPACVGFGGAGAGGGQGGGASIALYAYGSTTSVSLNGAMFGGSGGSGGAGGSGAAGAPGITGDAGAPGHCYAGCDNNCKLQGGSTLAGGAGGVGGPGGSGGPGGGGGGGPVYLYVASGDASITPSSTTITQIVGTGGAGGQPGGATGDKAIHP